MFSVCYSKKWVSFDVNWAHAFAIHVPTLFRKPHLLTALLSPNARGRSSPVSRGDVEEREAKSRVSTCWKRPLSCIYIFQTPCLNVRSYWWKRERVKHYSWTLFLMIMSYVTCTCSEFAMSKSVLWSQATQFRFYNEIASWPLSSSSLILLPLSCVIFFLSYCLTFTLVRHFQMPLLSRDCLITHSAGGTGLPLCEDTSPFHTDTLLPLMRYVGYQSNCNSLRVIYFYLLYLGPLSK